MVLFNRYKNGAVRAMTMSYDDGKPQDTRLVEIFNRYGIKATFHLIGKRYRDMTDDELKEVARIYEGHEISSHTFHHPHLSQFPSQLCTKEILDDRAILERIAGRAVRGMSYPYGIYNDDVIEAVKAGGMEYARTAVSSNSFALPDDWMLWHPTCHHNDNIEQLLHKFNGSWLMLPVFYIYGHSFEFDNDGNWDMIERFCEKAAGNPKTWYATNIEIVDYVNATRQIRFTLDGRIAYNPTAIDVWVEVGGEAVKLGSGETVDLGEEATK